uniref:Uncharacterized protein n=1 Tax=Romanomermis culicivorax TaxID=13658 RepID=A0A915KCJ9_ROMCU
INRLQHCRKFRIKKITLIKVWRNGKQTSYPKTSRFLEPPSISSLPPPKLVEPLTDTFTALTV